MTHPHDNIRVGAITFEVVY
ncbi:DUF1317 family protein [Escherichia coli]